MKHIASRDNPTYRTLLGLATQGRERRRLGQSLLDGEHVLAAALEAGHSPRMLVFEETRQATLAQAWGARLPGIPVLVLAPGLFKALSPVDSPSGLMALVDIPAAFHRAVPEDAGLLLLEDIQDPGNLGALLRVAAAAGLGRVCLSRGCAEAWSPKCLRGGQGAQFQLAIEEGADLVSVAQDCPGPVHAGLLGASRSLYQLDLTGPVGFAFGNEGAGLSPALSAVCQPFAIPMPGRVESLNVATAAAVCLFERVRQRGVTSPGPAVPAGTA